MGTLAGLYLDHQRAVRYYGLRLIVTGASDAPLLRSIAVPRQALDYSIRHMNRHGWADGGHQLAPAVLCLVRRYLWCWRIRPRDESQRRWSVPALPTTTRDRVQGPDALARARPSATPTGRISSKSPTPPVDIETVMGPGHSCRATWAGAVHAGGRERRVAGWRPGVSR